jgi:hypothetical protein
MPFEPLITGPFVGPVIILVDWDKIARELEWLRQVCSQSATQPTAQPQSQPTPAPTSMPSPTPEPDYIYRAGPDKPKTLSLHRPQDWATGLSFFNNPPVGPYIKFKAADLVAAGYIVRPDGNTPVYELWGGSPVTDPQTGQQAIFPPGHVTVYHSSQQYWDQWHQADLANKGTPNISPQLQAIYNLRTP